MHQINLWILKISKYKNNMLLKDIEDILIKFIFYLNSLINNEEI